jgi:pyrroline-5-carboxylate reductase
VGEIERRIGLIGAGNMAEAITGALIQSGSVDRSLISVTDVSEERGRMFEKRFGIKSGRDNQALFQESDIVILSVKPQILPAVLSGIASSMGPDMVERKCVISIAAGFPIRKLESFLYSPLNEEARKQLPIIRVMPNTPCLVLRGMSVMSGNSNAIPEDIAVTRSILGAMGNVLEMDESFLDVVTAMSGSGPAYVFYMIEAMINAGRTLGLDSEKAILLTLETFKGALALLDQVKESPEDLRRKVTSPGGTTEAAIRCLETNNVKSIFADAIRAARDRSVELSG